jgi:hypothetical protein
MAMLLVESDHLLNRVLADDVCIEDNKNTFWVISYKPLFGEPDRTSCS